MYNFLKREKCPKEMITNEERDHNKNEADLITNQPHVNEHYFSNSCGGRVSGKPN